MPLPVPPDPDTATIWTQWATVAAAVGGAAWVSLRRFALGKAAPLEPARHVILETASLADMAPLHEIKASLSSIAANTTLIVGMMTKVIERDTASEADEKLREMMRKETRVQFEELRSEIAQTRRATKPPSRSRRLRTRPADPA